MTGLDRIALLQAGIALVGGAALGLLHFGTLRRTVDAFAGGRTARALLMQLARLGLLAACLFVAARAGALPLLAAALGLLAGRAAIMHRERRAHD